MNQHPHIDLKPHIDSLCEYLGTSKQELMNRPTSKQPDVIKRLLFSYLYYKVGATYQNIANEFNLKAPSIFSMVQRANEELKYKDPDHLNIEQKLKSYSGSNVNC
jgi:hypothetical protein